MTFILNSWLIYLWPLFVTHMLEEDAEIGVGLRVDGGLEHREENVLQHLAKMGHEVPGSEDIAEIEEGEKKDTFLRLLRPFPFLSRSLPVIKTIYLVGNVIYPQQCNSYLSFS